MSRSFGFPTLEDGLSVLSKDELADGLVGCENEFFVLKNEFFLFAYTQYRTSFGGPDS
jgi:hypothetical protein